MVESDANVDNSGRSGGSAEVADASGGDGGRGLSRRGFLAVVGVSAAGASILAFVPTAAAAEPADQVAKVAAAKWLAGLATSTTSAAGVPITVRAGQFGAVFTDRQRAEFDVRVVADTVTWTARDTWGSVVRSGRAAVRRGRATFPVPVTAHGYYSLQLSASRRGKQIATAATSFALVAVFAIPSDSPFGLNTHLQPPQMAPLLSTLGITWARTDLTWTEIEPPPLAGWTSQVYQAQATVQLDQAVAHTGQGSVKIVNSSPLQPNYYATIAQQITVQPATTYTFSAWVKGQNVAPKALQFTVTNDWGSRIDVPSGTFDWTKVQFDYTTGGESSLNFRLLSSDLTGAAWMDDVSVVAAGSAVNLLVNPGFEQGRVTGYTFDTFAPYLDALAKARINPLPILDYANPKYDDGNTPYTDAGRAAFADYTTAVMEHWRGRFRAVEVFNEYNAGWFTTGPASADPVYYAQLLEVTHDAVKAVDPHVSVVGGVTYGTALDWLTKVFEAGGMDHLDAVSNHPYGNAPESGTPLDVEEEQVTALIKQYNGGKAKPVWISELGWSLGDELTTAGYLVRGVVMSAAGGVAKFFWYDLVGDQNFGLLEQTGDDYAPRPAFVAYATVIRQLTGARLVGGGQVNAGSSYCYRFTGSGMQDVAVLWSTDQHTPISVPVTRPVTLLDVTGTPTTMTPVGGRIYLTLTGAPIFLRAVGFATRTDLVTVDSRLDVQVPALVQTAQSQVPLTYVLDNTIGTRALDLSYTTAGVVTRVRAAAGRRAQVSGSIPVSSLQSGRNTLLTLVTNGRDVVGRLVSSIVVVEVPAGAIATVGTVDWTDSEFALAPGGYSDYSTHFPNDVAFTAGVDDPSTGWSYIHPGPDDGWAGGRVHSFTLTLPLTAAPTADLQLVVFLLDTHNTAPGIVAVSLNGGTGTTVSLPAGSGSGYADGNAFTSGDRPAQFRVRLPAAQLITGNNEIAITKTSGSWMVYDAVGIYPA